MHPWVPLCAQTKKSVHSAGSLDSNIDSTTKFHEHALFVCLVQTVPTLIFVSAVTFSFYDKSKKVGQIQTGALFG